MAFCPNCGTPNTDQAEKCVSCGFELSPKQKAKFKGTIMMSGVQAPAGKPPAAAPQAAPPPQQPAPQPQPASQPQQPAAGGRNMAFEKTIMGGPLAGFPPPGSGAPPPAQQPPAPQHDFARAATVEGPAPQFSPPAGTPSFTPPQAASAPPASQAGGFGGGYGGGSTTGGFGGGGGGYGGGSTGGFGGGGGTTGGFGGDSMAPPAKSNTGKVLAIGCAAILALSCVVGGVLYFLAKDKVQGMMGAVEAEGDALAWRGSLAEALNQVSALCRSDCNSAAVYFHPTVQVALMGEAKALGPASVQKLSDPTQSEARMLNATEDAAIATNLGLDPQQCVRITTGAAKVIGCSVPDASGNANLRIVHLVGVSTL